VIRTELHLNTHTHTHTHTYKEREREREREREINRHYIGEAADIALESIRTGLKFQLNNLLML
jgi:hypothetical protein